MNQDELKRQAAEKALEFLPDSGVLGVGTGSTVNHFIDLFRIEPEMIAADLHPRYLSTTWAEGDGRPVVKVQHHHAHIASCMAEHGIPLDTRPVLGVVLVASG